MSPKFVCSFCITLLISMLTMNTPPHYFLFQYIVAQYFGATIMMLASSTGVTVVLINVHYRGVFGNQVPVVVRTLVLDWLARLMCLKEIVDNNVSDKTIPQKKVQ